ncbi:MAG: energy-coupling factor transporter ATPase [Firmicutes bacterium]|nr:energy-coupling factor transporter ATPase [Candidatus Colimorpha enterica]
MADFITLKDLWFSYDPENVKDRENYILKGISLGIEEGSFVCVLGHNGSGKSTLAKIMNLVCTPTSGSVTVDGRTITEEPDEDTVFEIRGKVGMVFQNPDNQLVTTIVEDDVAFGPENLGVPSEEIRKRVDAALATVGMTEYAKHSTSMLSGGQKQRVAIAGVLAMQPRCIIFDESTAMLDPQGRRAVMDTIEKLHSEKGMTIIHITHNMDEAVNADRVIVVNDGRIFLDGTPSEVFSQEKKLREAGLGVLQVTELFGMLTRELGMKLPGGITDNRKGAEILSSALKNGKN